MSEEAVEAIRKEAFIQGWLRGWCAPNGADDVGALKNRTPEWILETMPAIELEYEEWRKFRLVPRAASTHPTDIKLSHAELPGVITEVLREAMGRKREFDYRELAKSVSKALVLHARRNGG
jgi:hypothetical protein